MFGFFRESKNIMFGWGFFLDCELDEKNGIIVIVILVIKFGFRLFFYEMFICDVYGVGFGLSRSFYFNFLNVEI